MERSQTASARAARDEATSAEERLAELEAEVDTVRRAGHDRHRAGLGTTDVFDRIQQLNAEVGNARAEVARLRIAAQLTAGTGAAAEAALSAVQASSQAPLRRQPL